MQTKKKKKTFLGLMKKYRIEEKKKKVIQIIDPSNTSLNFKVFKIHYIPLLAIIYIYTFMNFWYLRNFKQLDSSIYNQFYYYAKFSRVNKYSNQIFLPKIFYFTLTKINIIVFTKPKKQLFLNFFKEKPVFVFTGGQMRLILKEKKKSSKRLYKVAISLIKLSFMLLYKNIYFDTCYLRLINIGKLRIKLIREFKRHRVFKKLFYIFIIFKNRLNSQKFETRRAIKKYVRKRFKI